MKKEIIINATSTEIRVAITEDDRLAEIFLEVPDKERHVGSIYLGRVERVVQGMNAAFVSIGETQDAFLHFSDVGSAMDEFKDLLDEKDDEDDDEDDAAESGDKDKKVEARAPASTDDKKSGRGDQGRGRDGKPARDRERAPRKDAPQPRVEEDSQPTATDSDATAAPTPRERDGRAGDERSGDRRQGRDDRRGGRDRRDGGRDRAESRPETDGAVQPEPAEERPAQDVPAEENRGRGGNRRGGDRNDQSRREKEPPPRAEKEPVAKMDREDDQEETETGDVDAIEGGTPEQQEEQRKRRRKRGRRGGRGRNRRRDGGEEGEAGSDQTESQDGEASEPEDRAQDDRPAREPENRRRDDRAEKPADDRRRDDRSEKPADDRRRDDRAEKPADDRRRDDRRRDEKPADDRRRDDRTEKPADDRRRDEKPADDRRRDDRTEKPADDRRRDDRPRNVNDDRRRDDRADDAQPERRREDSEASGNESLSSDQRRNERSRDRERERYRHDDRVSDEGPSDDRESSQDDRRERDERTAPEARGREEGSETGAAAGNERGDGRRNNRRGDRRDRPRGERREGEAAEPRAEAPAAEQRPAELSHEDTYRPGTRGEDRPLKEDRRNRETSRRDLPAKAEAPAEAEAPREEAPANTEKSPRRARPARGGGRGKTKETAEPRAEAPATPEPAQAEPQQPASEEGAAKKPSARRRPQRGGKRGGDDSADAPVKGPTVDAKLPTFQTKRSGEVTIALEKGQDVIVQVTRESYASKGVRVTTKVSLPGRFLVLLPLDPSIGISRKVQLMKERRRLRRIAKSILPEGYGCIIRTVAQDKDEEVIKQDLTMLIDNWREVEQKIKQTNGPSLLYKDQSIANTVMRDLFTPDTNRVVIDNKALYKEIRDYVAWAAPQLVEKVEFYSGAKPIFDQFGIERELHKISERRTYIPSGGYIILDQTEAMMVIDVNSGRYAGKKDQELNSLRTNLESAREIARQIRLRDIGGLIVVDFIDLYDEKNRKKVYDELKREMKKDRAKSVVLPMTQFGLVQMTRQRIRQQVVQTISEPCPVCAGSGLVQSKSTVIRNIERWLARFKEGSREFRLTLTANPTIIDYLTEGSPSRLTKLMLKYFVRVKVVLDESLPVDEFHFFSLRQQADITDKFINEPKVKEKERDRDKEREKRDAREIREVEMS
ncbi:MAG: ribonuclease [Chlorobi bacterium]|nr:ribonuclease [Chlorobiota bacterium]